MSSEQATGTIRSRSLWVARKASAFQPYFRQLTLLQLEESLEKSEIDLLLQDESMRKKYKDDKETLSTHILHMCKVRANCVLLKGGIFPAMKIDPDSLTLQDLAIVHMSQVKAEYHFMSICLQ